MQRVSHILLGVALLGVCSVVPMACAEVVVASNLWDDVAADTEGWSENEPYTSVIDPSTGGVDDSGYLRIDYIADRGPGQIESVVYTDASTLFAGDWTDDMWLDFDFWSEDVTPDYLEVRFQSTTGGADIWRYSLTPSSPASDWTDFTASLAYSGLWGYGEYGDGDEETFLSDLATIDWVGIYIYDGDTGENSYGLDNWQLMVPEPAEYALAFSAMVVTWLSLRRRRKTTGASA